jgi:hypothetical protein
MPTRRKQRPSIIEDSIECNVQSPQACIRAGQSDGLGFSPVPRKHGTQRIATFFVLGQGQAK